MIEAHALPRTAKPLSATMVRRKRPPVLLPASRSRALAVIAPAPPSGWAADLRFFAICYLAGFIFFLIMLS
jgi:hypothetical protein